MNREELLEISMLKRVICIPDSFKGTLTSSQIIQVTQTIFNKHNPDIEVIGIEVADGGEGTVDAFLSISGGEKIKCVVTGPRFKRMKSRKDVTLNASSKWIHHD